MPDKSPGINTETAKWLKAVISAGYTRSPGKQNVGVVSKNTMVKDAT